MDLRDNVDQLPTSHASSIFSQRALRLVVGEKRRLLLVDRLRGNPPSAVLSRVLIPSHSNGNNNLIIILIYHSLISYQGEDLIHISCHKCGSGDRERQRGF